MDVPGFLRLHPPFDELSESELDDVVRATHVEFFPAGHVILIQGGEPAEFLYVVRTGAVEVLDGGHVVDMHQEGEAFGFVSLLTGDQPALTVRAHEETIAYLIERAVAERILSQRRGLSFLSRGVRRRELKLMETAGVTPAVDPWAVPARSLIARSPVWADASTTIADAARLMTSERVSSLLLRDGGSSAIVTDRDLRARVLAEGVDARRSVGDVASSPLITREGDATAGELLELMLEHRIHHVPVVDDHGDVAGIVTDTDIMALERRSVFLLRREIASATSAEEIARSGHRLPVMVADLVDASVDPLEVGHLVAVISDALTTRLLEVGVANLGEPPCPWSWLAFGSQARREQGLATDQDNGLAYGVPDGEVDPAAVDPYFARLATFVNDGLAEAGIPRCRAGVIASDPEWRGSVQDWQARFRGWVNDPGRKGSAFSGIAFDYRSVAGSLDVHPDLDPIVRWAGDQPDFLRHLARTAVLQRPPKGFVEDAVIEPRGTSVPTLDAKQSGIAVITNIARLLALRAGVLDNRTTRRLRSVVDAGHLDEDTGAALEEAFTLLWQIRFEHQSRRVRLGAPADDDVDPRLLGPLTRQALKEAFGIIDRVQGAIATDLGIRR